MNNVRMVREILNRVERKIVGSEVVDAMLEALLIDGGVYTKGLLKRGSALHSFTPSKVRTVEVRPKEKAEKEKVVVVVKPKAKVETLVSVKKPDQSVKPVSVEATFKPAVLPKVSSGLDFLAKKKIKYTGL